MHKAHLRGSTLLPLKYLKVVKAGLPEKGAAFFSDLCHYPRMDFPLFLISQAYILLPDIWEGFSLGARFSGLVHCWN